VTSGPDEPDAVLHLDVYPDADAGESGARYFRAHYPSHVWHCTRRDWSHWLPLTNPWPQAVTFHDDHLAIQLPVASGTSLWVASDPVLRYSDVLAWVDSLAGGASQATGEPQIEVTSLGDSAEGRRIPLLRFPGVAAAAVADGDRPAPALPRLLVLAGQHPSEHCGPWACRGIVDYLRSPMVEARALRAHFEVAVLPMINPDGNVRGLSGANGQGINLHDDFQGVAEGALPRSAENRLLWQWITTQFAPDVLLHFHGFGGWRVWSQPPYDGMYLLDEADSLYATPSQRAAYEALRARLLFDTPAYSGSWRSGRLGSMTLEHQLARRFGTLHVFYEINGTAVAAIEQYRRGPQVLGALARALCEDHNPWPQRGDDVARS
jgi:hypothetical protein